MNTEAEEQSSMTGKDPKAKTKGVPFVVTDANRDAWKGRSGARSRGLIVDNLGVFMPKAGRGYGIDSLEFLASTIARAAKGHESAIGMLATPRVARIIRNRPRLKALLVEAS